MIIIYLCAYVLCQMLALSCLDLMIEMDPNGHWVSFLSSRGYLKFLIDSLLASDHDLVELVTNNSDTLRPLYVYESKMVSVLAHKHRHPICMDHS